MNKLSKRSRIFFIILTIVIALEIFLVSSIPGQEVGHGPQLNFPWLYHFSVFFLFNFFLMASAFGNKKIIWKMLILLLMISLVYALLDELHQFFVPLRNPSVNDFLIDSAGIFISCLFYLHYFGKKSF